jgi:cytochrome P450
MASSFPKPVVQCGSRDRYSQFARSVERFIQSRRLAWHLLIYRATCFSLCHLWFLKLVFGFLRRIRPVAIFGKILVVTRARDVREVLERFDDFTLGDFIAPGMPWGTFLMTVDWRNQHAQERQLLQNAVHPTDTQKIRTIAAARCRRQIDAAGGQIDVVSQLLEPVVVDIAAEYYGIPPLAGCARKMANAMRDLAGIIMVKTCWQSSLSLSGRRRLRHISLFGRKASVQNAPTSKAEKIDQQSPSLRLTSRVSVRKK